MWRRVLAVVGLALAVAFLPQSAWATTTEPTVTTTTEPTSTPTESPTSEPSPTSSEPSPTPTTSSPSTSSPEPSSVALSDEQFRWVQALVIAGGLSLMVLTVGLVSRWGGPRG